MGCFNATCIVSGLPIEACTPVRFLSLVESQYHKGNYHSCYVFGRWQLRTPPVKAKYNDYGSVEDIEPGIVEQVFFKSFDFDVVEKGVGDNQFHDVSVRRGMSQDDWLNALRAGRVFVRNTTLPTNKKPEDDQGIEQGIPTMRRIEQVLKGANLPMSTSYGDGGFLVDEIGYGYIRVRNASFDGATQNLEKVLPFLNTEYAAMITCGSQYYAKEAEILVAPKPAPNRSILGFVAGRESNERCVSQAMIREDVWQILAKTKLTPFLGSPSSLKDLIKSGRALLKSEIKARKNPDERGNLIYMLRHYLSNDDPRNFFAGCLHGGEGISGFYFREALDLAFEEAKSEKELEAFFDALAETMFVQLVYGGELHGQWHPSTNDSQDGCWKEHRKFLKKLLKIRGNWEE